MKYANRVWGSSKQNMRTRRRIAETKLLNEIKTRKVSFCFSDVRKQFLIRKFLQLKFNCSTYLAKIWSPDCNSEIYGTGFGNK